MSLGARANTVIRPGPDSLDEPIGNQLGTTKQEKRIGQAVLATLAFSLLFSMHGSSVHVSQAWRVSVT